MEDENEVLDWGNEDDEQEQHRKIAAGDRSLSDVDDVEDSVSLGEDDDEQEYYAYQQHDSRGATANKESKPTPLSTSKSASHIREQQPPHMSGELKRENSSTSQALSPTTDSSQHPQNSTNQQSPQRSNSFTTRITHALPPKPVVANVPFLHPSHPSIVAATAMSTRPSARSESNTTQVIASSSTTVSATGTGGGRSSSSGAADPDAHSLPLGWEIRHPRSGDGVYYYNPQTSQSTWTRPVSSNSFPLFSHSHSSNARHHRGRSLSAGSRSPSSPRSNAAHLHPQEHPREARRKQPLPDLDITDSQASAATGTLSYEDRHYRPGGVELTGPSTDTRRGDRTRNEPVDPRFNPHPELAFTPPPSPPRSRDRERARSLSLEPLSSLGTPRGRESRTPRGARSGRIGRNGNTDADFATQRDHNAPRSYWSQATSNPPADFNISTHQGSRRQPRQQNIDSSFESPVFESRAIHHNGSTRGRNRDRDQPRVMEVREQNRDQNMSAPRIRSPPLRMHDAVRPFDLPSEHGYQQSTPTSVVSQSSMVSASTVPPPQRKRQSRFDKPLSNLTAVSSSSLSLTVLLASKTVNSEPAALHQGTIQDDPFVPDDIRSPPQEPQRGAELVGDEPTQLSVSQQVPPAEDDSHPPPSLFPSRRTRVLDRDSDQDQTHSSSEQEISPPPFLKSHRKREPLPPQSARFREISSRPKPPLSDHGQGQGRPPTQFSPNRATTQLPLGPRDAQRPLYSDSNNLPLGPRYSGRGVGRGYPSNGNVDREAGRGGDRRTSESIHAPPQSQAEPAMDVDVPPSGITPSPRISSVDDFPPSGSGMYADRESAGPGDILPRGPRAMSSKGPPRTASVSPVASFGYGPNTGGRVDRSPPPHLTGRANEGESQYEDPGRETLVGWKDDRPAPGGHPVERGQGHPPRGRNVDYSRVPSAPLSGPNSVPIGNRKGMGIDGPPRVQPPNRMPPNSGPPPGVGVADTRPPLWPSRSTRGRGGGLHPPPRESREWDDRGHIDKYGLGERSESSGPHRQRRDRSLPPFEKHQPLTLNTSVGRDAGPFSGGDQQNRFDPLQQPRTWTPRGVIPHEVIRPSFSAGSEGRTATPPPFSRELSQVSPTWETESRRPPGRHPTRLEGSRSVAVNVDSRSRKQLENLPPRSRDSYVPTPEPRRSGSLEDRLSDRYDERPIEPPRQLHVLPPNPALHRDHEKSYSPESRRRPQPDRKLPLTFEAGAAARDAPPLNRSKDIQSNRAFDEQAHHTFEDRNPRGQRPPRNRRLPLSVFHQEDPMAMDTDDFPASNMDPPEQGPSYGRHRPELGRHPHSLLDRISLDQSGNSHDEISSQSLQARVQIPSKRDRDEMVDRYPMDSSFDGEDGGLGDGVRKRRKSTKPRKQRRGGP